VDAQATNQGGREVKNAAAIASEDEGFVEFAGTADPELRNHIIESHLGLARHLARRFVHRGEPYDDLVQVASLALVKALDRFDPTVGVQFSTFATRTIVGELKRHFRDKGWAVRIPRRLQELHLELAPAIDALTQELGRAPTIREMAQSLEVDADDIIEALEAGDAYRSDSLDATVGDGQTHQDALGCTDHEFGTAEDRVVLAHALSYLAPRERTILRLRFLEDLSQTEIAEMVGVSQMQVSRLLTRSLQKLREVCQRASM
jgi:RNA polymerase sigma-B factor